MRLNIRNELLAGLTVALALIPQAIAFSFIAKVDPMVGIYTSFLMAVVTALFGGRPGMISVATSAMALVLAPLVVEHGVAYLFAATVLTGVIQFVLGLLRLDRLISFVPQSVIVGFTNALAILLFRTQLGQFAGASWVLYAMVAGTIFLVYALPRLTKAVPAALVAIIVMTAVVALSGVDLPTVGDMGKISRTLPSFRLPAVPFTVETLLIVLPYAFTAALVGLLQALLTANILADLTGVKGDTNRVSLGQGLGNIVTGLFGGMAGCGIFLLSVMNTKLGGRGRLSSITAGLSLLGLVLLLGNVVRQIPMAALAGIMIALSVDIFSWRSLADLPRAPLVDSLVMLATMLIIVYTGDSAKGIIGGVLLNALCTRLVPVLAKR